MAEPALARDEAPPLLRNVSFMLMWASVAASGFGDRLIQLVAWTLLGIDEAGADASSIQASVYFFFFIPYLVFSPLGGWLADTLPRKWIMFGCDQTRALIMLAAFLLVPAGAARAIPAEHVLFDLPGVGAFYSQWAVYAVVLGVGIMAAIFGPTRNATVPQIVRTRDLPSANAIILGLAVIASLIGILAGGWLIDVLDSLRAGLTVAIVSFAVSGCFFIFLRVRGGRRRRTGPSQWQRLVQGASYIARHKPVLQLVILGVMFWAASHVLVAAIAALNARYYTLPHPLIAMITGDPEAEALILHLAVMNATLGVGMLTTALVISFFNTAREVPFVITICLLLTGVCVLGLAGVHSFGYGLAFAFAVGFFGNAMVVYVNSQTQSICPNFIRGRVFGVREIFGTIAAVGVNLAIWRAPETDALMVPLLYGLAGAFIAVALLMLPWVLTRGPMTRTLNVLWHLCRAYTTVWHGLQWRGVSNVPREGPVVLASNHTTALDPLLIQSALPRRVRWVMLKAFEFRVLGWLWRAIEPVSLERGAGVRGQVRALVEALTEGGDMVGMFPEGRLQRDQRELDELQPGVIMVARRSGAPLVPVWIAGTPRRRWMLLHFAQPSRSRVAFGEPFRVGEEMDNDEALAELRRRMEALAGEQ